MTVKKSEQIGTNFFPVLAKYDMKSVKIEDRGLARYINIDTENIYLGEFIQIKCLLSLRYP